MKIEHYIEANDGIKTFVLELIPDEIKSDIPFFCIHGLTRNHKDFEPIFDELLKTGRKIYAIDVRGRGRSDYDYNAINYNPITYMNDVLNIFQKLEIPKAIFIGTSMGGIVSMLLGAYAPHLVAAIILNDVGPEVCEKGIARIRNYVGDNKPSLDWNEACEKVKNIAGDAYPDKKDDNQFWLDFTKRTQKQTSEGIVFDYDANIRQNVQASDENAPAPSLWQQFAMIQNIPFGVIQGEISDILTNEIIAKMQAEKPQLIYSKIPNTGHAPILNEQKSLENILKIAQSVA